MADRFRKRDEEVLVETISVIKTAMEPFKAREVSLEHRWTDYGDPEILIRLNGRPDLFFKFRIDMEEIWRLGPAEVGQYLGGYFAKEFHKMRIEPESNIHLGEN